MAKEMTDYDKQIEVKKKELERVEKQIVSIIADRDRKIKESNAVIYDNKDKAEKIIADANAKAESIVAAASKIKSEAQVLTNASEDRARELDEKEKAHVEACKATVKDQEKLAQDKIDFGKKKQIELAKVEDALAKARELTDIIASFSKAIYTKIAEITKI
jgi:hypothetical protein